ncbi:hypothetical protein CHS0354_002008 [Potamilus streckersoni]|uniref:DNA2/NAM7 helicase-like C-terminal domain-containing protein n=1 Tax=Potamilus streckersoni TaxID=2493646 RepID=A0AAE0W8K0_9BIVA|nr:hypothetical protein CHS0354_002008 [Potamilus streckersoni]
MSDGFAADNDTIYRILNHWNVLLNYEESKSAKIYGVNNSVAALEGRSYLKLPLSVEDNRAFFTGNAASMNRFFFAGYPVIEVTTSNQRPYLTTPIKFTIGHLSLPNLDGIEPLTQTLPEFNGQVLTAEKPPADEDEAGSVYFTDPNLFEELLAVPPERVRRFTSQLNTAQRGNPADIFSQLLELPEGSLLPTDDIQEICVKLNELFKDGSALRLRFYPYGLIWFLDSGQPTLQLRRDIQAIITDRLADELPEHYPFIRFFRGNSKINPGLNTAGKTPSAKKKEKKADKTGNPGAYISADKNRPTESQQAILEQYSASPLTVVEGPPGTGKTKIIRDLIVNRLFSLCQGIENDNIPQGLDNYTSVITSANNISVDHALDFYPPGEYENLLPCYIRLGNRKVLKSETLPFLEKYTERLRAFSPAEAAEEFKQLRRQFGDWESSPPPETMPDSIYRLLTLWVVLNQVPVLKLLADICDELERTSSFRVLFSSKNRELFFMVFPVIGTTLLSVRSLFPLKTNLWGLTIIDEAGQCLPQNTVSVMYRTQKMLVFGDTHQLEPIYSTTYEEYDKLKALRDSPLAENIRTRFMPLEGSDISLQKLMQEGSHHFMQLREHFRCRPEIIGFCAELCGYKLTAADKPLPAFPTILDKESFWLLPAEGTEESYAGSWLNRTEGDAAVQCYLYLVQSGLHPREIAVLTPFRGQMNYIMFQLRSELSKRGRLQPRINFEDITVATAHRFQGGERRTVLFSPVTFRKNPDFLNSKKI